MMRRPTAAPVLSLADSPSDVADLLRGIVAAQARQAEVLDAVLRLLERGRGARDQADEALLVAVVEAIGDRAFTVAQLLAHTEADQRLRDALVAADVDNGQQLGCVFRRLEGAVVAGFRLERVRDQRAGVVWQVRVSGD